jgi:iron complex outermembrane receptor protein
VGLTSLSTLSSILFITALGVSPAHAQGSASAPGATPVAPAPAPAPTPAPASPTADAPVATPPADPAGPAATDATPVVPVVPAAPAVAADAPPPVTDPAPDPVADPGVAAPNTEDLSEMSLEDLLNVEVTAPSKKPQLEAEAPAVVQVITASEISWLGFNTLEEVLEYAVGLSSVNGEGNTFTTTTVRGNTLVNYQTNTLLLLDGVPIYSPYHGSFDFSAIPLSSIRQIEIVKGSNSVLYGTNAVSAVIDIRTKDKDTTTFKARLGRFHTAHTESAFFRKFGDVTASVFLDTTATRGEPLDYVDEAGVALRLPKSSETHALIATLGYKGAYARVQQFQRDAPSVKTRGFPVITDFDGNSQTLPEQNVEDGWLLTGGYVHKLSKIASLSSRLTYYRWRLDKDVINGLWNYSSQQLQAESDLSLEPTKWASLTVGAQLEYQKARRFQGDVDVYDVGKDDRPTYTAAVYVNGEVKVHKQLSLYYGGRFYLSYYDAVDDAVVLKNLSPRAAVVYKPKRNFVVKAIFGQSFRAPTYFEKEAASPKVLGSPDLDPEKSTSFDLVASYKTKWFTVNLDGFHQVISDKITRVKIPDDPMGRSENANVGDVTFDGVEAWGKVKLSTRLEGFGGYAGVFRAEQDPGDGMTEDFKLIYKHQLTGGFITRITPKFAVSGSAKYLSRWEDAAAYGLQNARLIYRPLAKEDLELSLDVHNLLDTRVEVPEIARDKDSVPTIPKTEARMVFGTLSYSF